MASSDRGSGAPRLISSDFLDPTKHNPDNLAVVVLNWQLPSVTPLLIARAAFCVCADGGANRLHDEVPLMFPHEDPDAVRARFLPHLIKGDLDSVRPNVLAFYRRMGVPVADLSHDQMSTDLQKCISYIEAHFLIGGEEAQAAPEGVRMDAAPNTARKVDTIVAVGALGGRLDHILSSLSTLYTFRHMNIVLCGDGNLTRLIPAGKAVIAPHRALEGPTCGLIPLLGRAVATSQGLRWNLEDTEMQIGGLISTSNIIEGNEIQVESDVDLVWTTEFRDQPKGNGVA